MNERIDKLIKNLEALRSDVEHLRLTDRVRCFISEDLADAEEAVDTCTKNIWGEVACGTS